MTSSLHNDKLSIQEQAAQWLIELQDTNPALQKSFALWLRESPRHVEEFLFINALWHELDNIEAHSSAELEILVAEAQEMHASSNVVELHTDRQSLDENPPLDTRPARKYHRPFVAAATVMLCVSLVIAWQWLPAFMGNDTYSTMLGEQRTVRLKDGSLVHLNTNTKVETHFSFKGRDITLLDGEALFDVAKDPDRPFRVRSNKNIIQAIGTQFNVYQHGDVTKVAVIEGIVGIDPDRKLQPQHQQSVDLSSHSAVKVSVDPARLVAGQEAALGPNGEVLSLIETDVRNAIAWRTRRLVFQSQSLSEVAAQFNRYNRLQIRIEGDELAAKRLTGTFNADDPKTLIRFLAAGQDLQVDRSGNNVVIRQAR
ncbi:MAG: FecR domain-containing protein [Porticoccaceae bacterium]